MTTNAYLYSVDIHSPLTYMTQRYTITPHIRVAAMINNTLRQNCPCDKDENPLYAITIRSTCRRKQKNHQKTVSVIEMYGKSYTFRKISPLALEAEKTNLIPRSCSDEDLQEILDLVYKEQ